MHAEERRLQDIKDTLVAKVHRNVTLKKGAVLAFMTAQFGTLGKAPPKGLDSFSNSAGESGV